MGTQGYLPGRKNGVGRWQHARGVLFLSAGLMTGFLATGCLHLNPPQTPSTLCLQDPDQPKLTKTATADVQIALGRSLEQEGAVKPALAAYREAVKLDPRRADAYLRLAILADCQGKCNESVQFYRQALKASPGNADIYADMGYSLYLQGRYPEADMNLRQALVIAPGHRRAHTNLGMLLARTNQVDEALVEFHQAHCSRADADLNVAFALSLDRHWDEARRYYQLALAADPQSQAARNGLQELQALSAKASARNKSVAGAAASVQLSGLTNPADAGKAPITASAGALQTKK